MQSFDDIHFGANLGFFCFFCFPQPQGASINTGASPPPTPRILDEVSGAPPAPPAFLMKYSGASLKLPPKYPHIRALPP